MLDNIARAYDFTDEEQIYQVMEEFLNALKKLKARGYVDNEAIGEGAKGDEILLGLLRNLEFLQEAVRRNIRGLER